MNKLLTEFREIRKVSTPWVVIRTTDYMATIKSLLSVRANGVDEPPPACMWTCVDAITSPVQSPTGEVWSKEVPIFATPDDPPFIMLKNAKEALPENGILFVVCPDATVWNNAFTMQAASNLRDVFKTNFRTLVILGVNPQMPEFLREDVPVLDDPLPDEKELERIVENLLDTAKLPLTLEVAKAASMCLGMTRFAAEECVARKLRKTGIDFAGLAESQKSVIEASSNKALTFEKEKWTFDEVGGLAAFKDFMEELFGGPEKPALIVRVDEIDKSITAASAGAVSDNTGVSQDILKCLLTALEDNKWMGLLAVGGPGTGKTLASICTGNQYQTRTLALDLGAVKGSLVGESEGKIRRVVEILKSIGGERVLFMATANRLDTMPPELQRRFWLGTWFWDLPTQEEREKIWEIQLKRHKIKADQMLNIPNSEAWTGSDIRNCCRMAYVCNTPLDKAAQRITIAGVSSKVQIEALRSLAEVSGFRSANVPGPYKRPLVKGRKVNL